METSNKTHEVLNDLIEINNDRVAGFEKAAKDLEAGGDADLKAVFAQLANESRTNAAELRNLVGADAETGTSLLGDIHRAWIDVKATFSGHDRKSILEECERGEDAIKKAYRTALQDGNEISANAVAVISRQQQGVNAGHDQIKALRDSQA
ncbi:MAG: PA2169 family four-helix-bundle protein [Sphingobacteriales bacterium]|nr:MAG: PA2169 family four-helix-bundle protein [Sphingobacteriales bacterium]